ncbi:DUF3575 domain-containing protein [Chryseobacterium luquanense]|uniref:DUF3575 domain-containing protein n=1 Tax=Chryseobacterium luquanense TaxID=2983766 RepID=A0ABT3Y065_9FLAO|nr:DUF3575 domain-containing protein [Chryseobacterium luquanense]MCX8531499.1 DUF3575 domain-containing protein [Chryseobacterium luquanense]
MKYTIKIFSKIVFILLSLHFLKINAQKVELKVNTLFLPLAMINLAVEKPLNKKFSIQAEGFISPWKSIHGKNLQFYMGTLEGRYYFDEVMKKWYVGAYGSITAFNIQKWNYLSASPVYDSNGNPEVLPDGSVRITERYQKGLALIFGVSGGYHFVINEKLGLDIYAGIGATQSIYKGYLKDNNERYDGANDWNKSGEIIPTRGGVMLTYKFQ